jgi:hypothetical protein
MIYFMDLKYIIGFSRLLVTISNKGLKLHSISTPASNPVNPQARTASNPKKWVPL